MAALTAELLDYLATADAEFRPVLAQRLGDVIRRFAPTKRWHVDNMLRVRVIGLSGCEAAGNCVCVR